MSSSCYSASSHSSRAASPEATATEELGPHLVSVTCDGRVRLPLPHVTFRRLALYPSRGVHTVAADVPRNARPLRLVVTALIHEGTSARIYRAREVMDSHTKLHHDKQNHEDTHMDGCNGDATYPSREFVLKTDFLFAEGRESALAREASHYDVAAPLQGLVIPTCYGLFEAEPQGIPFARRIRCLLLEYCGAPLRTRKLSQIPRQMKARIIDKAFYFHDMTAMAHGNLWDGHLLARGGTKRQVTRAHNSANSNNASTHAHDPTSTDASLHPLGDPNMHARGNPNIHARVDPAPDAEPFFVDLSECRQHACRCTMEVVEGDPRPSPSEFRCKEIWELVNALGVWGEEER